MSQPVVWVSTGMFSWGHRQLADNALFMLREWTREPSPHRFIHMDPLAPPSARDALAYRAANQGPWWQVEPGMSPGHLETLGMRAAVVRPEDLQRALGSRPLVVHTTSYHLDTMGPFWRPLHPDVLVYEALENVAAPHETLAARHRAASAEADVVVSISEGTAATLDAPPERILHWGSAVDPTFWRRPPAAPQWTFGFFGNLMDWIDFDLLDALAAAMPEDRIALIGPVAADTTERLSRLLSARPNVVYQPAVSYGALPDVVRHMAIGLLPRTASARSRASDPLKLYEYLAAGKPVVSSLPVPDAVAPHVYYGDTPAQFVAACRQARGDWAKGRHDPWAPAIQALLEERSWRRRAADVWDRAMAELA